MSRMDIAELAASLRDLAEPLAEARGVDLLDVEVKGPVNRRLVRLTADATDGLDIDTIAALSKAVGRVLDGTDLLPGSYTLEVTSPGIDRPLTSGRDFARQAGHEVRLVVHDGEGTSELTGRVVRADDARVVLDTDDGEQEVPLETVETGRVVLPW